MKTLLLLLFSVSIFFNVCGQNDHNTTLDTVEQQSITNDVEEIYLDKDGKPDFKAMSVVSYYMKKKMHVKGALLFRLVSKKKSTAKMVYYYPERNNSTHRQLDAFVYRSMLKIDLLKLISTQIQLDNCQQDTVTYTIKGSNFQVLSKVKKERAPNGAIATGWTINSSFTLTILDYTGNTIAEQAFYDDCHWATWTDPDEGEAIAFCVFDKYTKKIKKFLSQHLK